MLNRVSRVPIRVFRSCGEAVCGEENTLTQRAIVFLKNSSSLPLHQELCIDRFIIPVLSSRRVTGAAESTARKPLSRCHAFSFLRRPEQLTAEEQADLLALRQTHPEVNHTSDLAQQFAQMVRTRTGEQLDPWRG